jgi:F-box/WD-40 domain protein MET30
VSPLHGHREWVNKVVIWSSEDACKTSNDPTTFLTKENNPESTPASQAAQLLLFSASDDATIRVWDLKTMTCLRVLEGHIAQVQALKVLTVDVLHNPEIARFPTDAVGAASEHHTIGQVDAAAPSATSDRHPPGFVAARDYSVGGATMLHGPPTTPGQQPLQPIGLGSATPIVVSGSLDNQIKFWDVEKGVCTKTLFGHVQGVWDLACNQLRIVSASHDRSAVSALAFMSLTERDRTLKIWDVATGRCSSTLVGHTGASRRSFGGAG